MKVDNAEERVRFSDLPLQRRIEALFGEGAAADLQQHGSMLAGQCTLHGRTAYIAATDPAVARGAIGVAEADGLAELMRSARARPSPLLLLLDSSGARVDQGLVALGGFRRLFREALRAKLEAVPMLALLGRSCFGGASMLACLCDRRIYLPDTRLATSGPAVIEGVSGSDELNAGDADAVRALMGARARARLHSDDAICDDSSAALGEATAVWLNTGRALQGADVQENHARLRKRLDEAAMLREDRHGSRIDPARLASLVPPAYALSTAGHAFIAEPPEHSGKAVFLGAAGAPVDAVTCWTLSGWLLDVSTRHPVSPLVLILDSEGHAATVADERVLLADYLVHLSLSIAHASRRGHRSVLWIPGAASGASYVAFAAAVDRVSALPSARLAVLPPAAVRQIIRSEQATATTPQEWIDAGVADALLDARLQRYADDGAKEA